ncbi:helix-turn-helix transcriptional regulator [Actinomadura harenae]|uniref:Helix-turn-helix domain-containing protein n=2 Tax=Actinomadura harenae TaxID=2483351 RepID=A0A3M2M7I7_9ACTN|nr:helix-turn-helix domain-containing protein [Actinomadura harenae]
MAASFVRLFWRRALLEEAIDWLLEHGYQVVRLDASTWEREQDMLTAIAKALDFPDHYGRNLDALNDCLSDVAAFEYGARRVATGLVVAFTGYDRFTARCPRAAQIVLDIIADQARGAIHRDPARPWSVAGLGEHAGLSRAAFSRRFTALVGRPPLTYLTWWRLTTAMRLLRDSDAPLGVVAEQVGYGSEFAFANAFKREFNIAPGRYRRNSRSPGRPNPVDSDLASP